MRIIAAVLLLCSCIQTMYSQATLQGVVKSETNETIPYATVFIEGTKLGAESDKNGKFTITNIPASTYKVVASAVGFLKTSKKITLTNGVQNITFKLNSDTQLDEVELFGERNRRAEKLETLTRLPLAPNEQLQSISVLSHKLIDQQNALTLSDVTKNVAGVYTFATYGNTKESMSLRGFRGIPILKNGVRVHSDFRGQGVITDMAGVDNIQVLKGVSAISQGLGGDLGSVGGVINIVTKTPKFHTGGEVSLRAGSFGRLRPTFDVYSNIDADKKHAFRIAGSYDRADSFRAHVGSERFYVNPSYAWKPDSKTTVTLEMDYMHDSRTPDQGTVSLGTYDVNKIYKLPNNNFMGYESDNATTKNLTYAIRVDRNLNDKLSIKAGYFASDLDIDTETSYAFQGSKRNKLPELAPEQRYRELYGSGRKDYNSVLQLDLVGKDVETGFLKHTFQIGADYRTSEFENIAYKTNYESGNKYADIINVFEPINNTRPTGITIERNPDRDSGSRTESYGFTIQDKITLSEWADVFVGLRYTTVKRTKGDFIGKPLGASKSDDAFNPLVGFNLKPSKNIIVFGSYASSSDPRTSFYLDVDGNELGTERWDQVETGIKSSWLNDALRFNVTGFYTLSKNLNLPVYDNAGNDLGYYMQGGEDIRNGLEIELIGRVLPNLEVIGGYSYLDARYKDHASYYYNSRPYNTPKHTANVWANYKFTNALDGLSLGAGAYYLGERPHNVWSRNYTHTGVVPGVKPYNLKAYTTVNLQASYKFNEKLSIDVFGNNIFNEVGYNAYRTVYINRIEPASFGSALRYKF